MNVNSKWARLLTMAFCLPLLATRGHDVRYAAGKSALCIPFDTGNRHVAFQGKVNGRDGLWLVLDTGASGSVLDETVAASLGLEAVGEHQSLGAGGSVAGSTVHGVDVDLSGFQLLDQTMGTLSLTSLAAQAGRRMDGILGHPLFARCVVEIDYEKKCASLFDAGSYKYRGSGVSLPVTFIDGLPYVQASVVLPDGRAISGKFVIDTGASTTLLLSPDVVEREGVVASLAKTMTVQAHGVGGASAVRLARVAKLELGGFTLADPVTALQSAGTGRISAEGTIGNIGGGVLSRFKVVFDYSRHRMILEPGAEMSKPFEADMSGLGLASLPPDFRRVTVARVLEGSPALEAGVRPGDEIESVDGKPAGDIGLSTLRDQLREEGRDVKLTLLRGTERVTLGLKTRRLI